MSKFKGVSIDADFELMERQEAGTLRFEWEVVAKHDAVIPRESVESSTPRHLDSVTAAAEYWIARPSAQLRTRRAMTGGL
ncbi:hypothetical protein [Bradyrhizobium guangzhouense]|uniref:hypothetical protein n=1 Tax=Bradyrhizobium guangzhouense TaxID=1325095 RepID=UPI0013E8BE71|nr:hypothetical protein [Bradyrhizobium guangzhouense]